MYLLLRLSKDKDMDEWVTALYKATENIQFLGNKEK